MRKIILFLSFVLIGSLVVSSISVPMQAAIPASERAALVALYNAANGDNWPDNNGWKTPPLHTDGFAMPGTEGTWYGIVTDSDHVTNISLAGNNLSGTIPTSLMDLTIVQLFIRGNCLSTNNPGLITWLDGLDPEWEGHQCNPAFGSFDTPINGSTVAGSIAVTGWALDESGLSLIFQTALPIILKSRGTSRWATNFVPCR